MIQGRFPDSRTSPAPRRLIMGYCGTSLQAANMEAPIGVEGLVKTAIDPLRGTMVDTLYWQMNTDPYFGSATHHLTDWFSHPTQVGPVWGQGRERSSACVCGGGEVLVRECWRLCGVSEIMRDYLLLVNVGSFDASRVHMMATRDY